MEGIMAKQASLRIVSCLMLLAVVSACSKPTALEKEASLPNGRYMMLNGPEGGVYILNTSSGFFRFCKPRNSTMAPDSTGVELEVECGAGVTI